MVVIIPKAPVMIPAIALPLLSFNDRHPNTIANIPRRGTDILEALRGGSEDLIPHTRVIVLTNFEQDDESRMAMEKKADGYLIKAEITPSKLLSVIAQLDQPA